MRGALRGLVLLAVATVGCASTDEEAADGQGQQIRESVGTVTSERPEVGMLLFPGGAFATGTLVRPRIVLTSAHNVLESTGGGKERSGTLQGQFVYRIGQNARTIDMTRYVRRRDRPLTRTDSHDDVALIELAEAPQGLTPAAMATTNPRRGARMTIIGYGTSDCGSIDYWNGGGSWITGMTKRKATYRYGDFAYVACEGDSGGPNFGDDGRIYGLTAAGTLFGLVTASVPDNRAWIDEQIAVLER